MQRERSLLPLIAAGIAALAAPSPSAETPAAASAAGTWRPAAARDEIRPAFTSEPTGGRDGTGSLVIAADERESLSGHWERTFTVAGGKHYRFAAFRRIGGDVPSPRRTVLARILW